MQAKKTGICHGCGKRIWIGEDITWNRRAQGQVFHLACFDPTRDYAKYETPTEESKPMNWVKPTVETPVIETPVAEDERPNQHPEFQTLLTVVKCRLNAFIVGPAGSGKTTACKLVAEELGLPFFYTGAINEPFSLLGFTDATGKTVRTQFRECWENGGVFCFDEIDGSHPNALLAFNGALANGICAFPDAVLPKHKDCVLIATANTFGHGATSDYVGRAKLDAASVDRFVQIRWDYDSKLEASFTTNSAWLNRVRTIRERVKAKEIKVVVSPRATIYGASLLAQGMAWAKVEEIVLRKGMTDDQWNSVR